MSDASELFPPIARPRNCVRGCLLALVLLTLIAHGRDLTHDFLEWDDQQLVAKNPILNPVTPERFARVWTGPISALYTPLAYSLWSALALVARVQTADAHGATLNPMMFHLLNVLLHVGAVVLAFDVIAQLLLITPISKRALPSTVPEIQAALIAAAFGAAVFAVHPLQVEPVAWISGMNNVLAGLCSLACVAAYVRFAVGSSHAAWRWYAVSLVMLLLALLSKPTAIATPIVLAAVDGLVIRRSFRRTATALLPMAVMATPFVAIGHFAQPSLTVISPTLLQRLMIAGDSIGFYLQKLVWPTPLLMDYSRTPQFVLQTGGSAIGWTALAIFSIGLCIAWRRNRWLVGAAAVFVAGFSLVLGLVPFEFQVYSTVADRYVYLAMLGPSLAVAVVLARFGRKPLFATAAGMVFLMTMLSIRQSGYWQDAITICTHTIEHNDRSLVARSTIGAAYRNAGELSLAEANYVAALSIRPDDRVTNYNYGNLLLDNRPADALKCYKTAREAGYESPDLLSNMGIAYYRVGDLTDAVDAFRSVLKMDPGQTGAGINLGNCLAVAGHLDEAENCYREAAEDPAYADLAHDGLKRIAAMRVRLSHSPPRSN